MRSTLLAIAICCFCCSACGIKYTMDEPVSFRQYQETSDFKMITAQGVKLKAREVENYPKGDLDFWKNALEHHLLKRGYSKKGENCFTGQKGHKACTLEFMLPHGAEDWVFSQTIFVVDDRIVLVEAAGPFKHYQPVEQELKQALLSFDPK